MTEIIRTLGLEQRIGRGDARRLLGNALEMPGHPTTRCMVCSIIAQPGFDDIRDIHIVNAIVGTRPFFFVCAAIGADGGTFLSVCSRCMRDNHAALARIMELRK
jgi:hypothetical protein